MVCVVKILLLTIVLLISQPMQIVVAPDSFKECLSSALFASAIAEGKIDAQTASGKTISGVGQLAKKYNLPVIALAGEVTDSLKELYNQGVTAVFSIGNSSVSVAESKARAAELLTDKAEQLMLIVKKSELC